VVWTGTDWIKKQPLPFLQRVYNDRDVITRDELPDWRINVTANKDAKNLQTEALSIYPNPANGYTLNASLTLAAKEDVTIVLTNALGQQIVRTKASLKAGANTFQVPIDKVSSGVYQLTVQAKDQPAITKRVIVTK
jgi:mannan endo-1,4-beta-mannosidase